MTAEQLEELLGKVSEQLSRSGLILPTEEINQLASLAPSLASRVLAAEKLVEALESISIVDDDGWTSDGHERCTEAAFFALTAYREARK